MDVDELMKRAWAAVEKAGVPEVAQPAALQEAVAFIREQDGGGGNGGGRSESKASGTKRKQSSPAPTTDNQAADTPDEATFFNTLASESGVDEEKLRDALLYKNGNVTVTPPTRMFGDTKTAQAKAVTALVAGARAKGMGETPVNAEAVHDELKRKQCWDMNNFANKHLGKLQGFNGGSDRTEITTTSKWVGEFEAAVKQALGEADDEDE